MSDSASICGYQMDTVFGFYLPEYEDVSPEIQTNFVKVLGRNGYVNVSKQDDQLFFNSVERTWRFEKVTRTSNNADVNYEKRVLRNALLGVEGKIILDDDTSYYYYGFVTKIDVSCEEGGRIVAVITAMTDPFKYKSELTEYSHAVNEYGWVVGIVNNGRMPAEVTITNDFNVTVGYSIEGTSYTVTFAPGTHVLDDINMLPFGRTSFEFHGVDGATGNVTISFREGYL